VKTKLHLLILLFALVSQASAEPIDYFEAAQISIQHDDPEQATRDLTHCVIIEQMAPIDLIERLKQYPGIDKHKKTLELMALAQQLTKDKNTYTPDQRMLIQNLLTALQLGGQPFTWSTAETQLSKIKELPVDFHPQLTTYKLQPDTPQPDVPQALQPKPVSTPSNSNPTLIIAIGLAIVIIPCWQLIKRNRARKKTPVVHRSVPNKRHKN
jgi:hypothetical protein